MRSSFAAFDSAGVVVDALGGDVISLRAMLRAAHIAREWKPDIVHGAVFEGSILATLAGTLARVPHIVVEETTYPIRRSWRGRALFRLLALRADRCVAVSPAVAAYLRDAGLPPRKIELIVNGVAAPSVPRDARARLRRELGIPEHAIVIGSVGRIYDAWKRYSDLIRAVATLNRSDAHLLIVGDGPDVGALRELARSLRLDGTVTLAGHRDDVGPMYAVMDIFALASDAESFGLVLVEAMFAELPVVATRVGGIRDIVMEDETGFLVSVGQPSELARAIRRLAEDPILRRRFGEAGLARAERSFSSNRYTAEVAGLYRRLVSGARS
jgi:glycosyltransferase involved in cell wall biosynthesis